MTTSNVTAWSHNTSRCRIHSGQLPGSVSQQRQQVQEPRYFNWTIQTTFNCEHDDDDRSLSDLDDGSILLLYYWWNRHEENYTGKGKQLLNHTKTRLVDIFLSSFLSYFLTHNSSDPEPGIESLVSPTNMNIFPLTVFVPMSSHTRLVQDALTMNLSRLLGSGEIRS